MHRLIKIRLVRDLESLEERLRSSKHTWLGRHHTSAWRPAADFCETSQGLVLRMELAGVAPEDLQLSLSGQEQDLHLPCIQAHQQRLDGRLYCRRRNLEPVGPGYRIGPRSPGPLDCNLFVHCCRNNDLIKQLP